MGTVAKFMLTAASGVQVTPTKLDTVCLHKTRLHPGKILRTSPHLNLRE